MAKALLVLLIVLAASNAPAETCKYVDGDGKVIYANVPQKNAHKEKCFETLAPEAAQAPAAVAPARTAEPAGRPKVDGITQKRRDDQRRRILEEELAREQTALEDSRRQLGDQEAVRNGDEKNYQRVLERLKPFQDAVATHEKNLDSLKRELSNLP